MTPAIYNGCTLLGVASIGVGVGLEYGLGHALIAVGGLVLLLTQMGARMVNG